MTYLGKNAHIEELFYSNETGYVPLPTISLNDKFKDNYVHINFSSPIFRKDFQTGSDNPDLRIWSTSTYTTIEVGFNAPISRILSNFMTLSNCSRDKLATSISTPTFIRAIKPYTSGRLELETVRYLYKKNLISPATAILLSQVSDLVVLGSGSAGNLHGCRFNYQGEDCLVYSELDAIWFPFVDVSCLEGFDNFVENLLSEKGEV